MDLLGPLGPLCPCISQSRPEYWLIDPVRQEALFYRLSANRRYRLAPPDAQGIFHSAALEGFWLNPEWLWQKPLPDELEILRGFAG